MLLARARLTLTAEARLQLEVSIHAGTLVKCRETSERCDRERLFMKR